MNADAARRYAAQWIRDWNAVDVEAVVSHFAADCVFTSPRAAVVTGNARVEGRDALRAYWDAAVRRITSIAFELDRAVWDSELRQLAIVYTSNINGEAKRACELLRFNEAGEVVEGEAMYGAEL